MAFTCTNHSNGIYQKETSYGKAGNFTFGLEMLNATFTLEESKSKFHKSTNPTYNTFNLSSFTINSILVLLRKK